MNKKSTTNDLLLYLFNETQMAETVLTQLAIDFDAATEQEFEEIKAAFALLDSLLESPSEKCISRIMEFSRTGLVA